MIDFALIDKAISLAINVESLPLNPVIGKFYRLPAIGKKRSDKSCYLKLVADRTAILGNWGTGEKGVWFDRDLPTDKKSRDDRMRAVRLAQDEARTAQMVVWAGIAKQAQALWLEANEADPNHPYLVKKQLKPNGIKQTGNKLIIPVYSAVTGEIQSLQFIEASGFKQFLTGGRTTGGFFAVRPFQPETDVRIIIAEGWGTSQALEQQYQVQGWHVAAFSSFNLAHVAPIMRKRYPNAQIILAGDNDLSGTGQKAAHEAATAVAGKVAIPTFSDDERAKYGKVSDWADKWMIDQVNGGHNHE